MSKGTLYIFCGKMASGKSTLARQISNQKSLTLISEDELLSKLYPDQVTNIPSYSEFSGKVKRAIKQLLIDLLNNGTSIVLDFPANTIAQRQWIKDVVIQAGACSEFHYLDCSEEICKDKLKERAVKEPSRHATDTVEIFDAITRYFEPPSDDEGFEILIHKRS